MALRDVGVRGWALVAATIVTASIFLIGAATRAFSQPPWDIAFGSLSIGLPILTLFTVWYLYDVAWAREIRRRAEVTPDVPAMATTEALVRLMDYAGGLLDRLTRYTGWFFFMILLAIFLVPSLFILVLQGWLVAGSILPSLFIAGVNTAFWIAYFYFYYKIKHENDIWKERIQWLREREKTLLER